MTDLCHDTRKQFDELLDGELSGDARRAVEEHLAGCAECRDELAALETLLAEARALPREIAPRTDLWPGIEERLTPRRPSLGSWLSSLLPDWGPLTSPSALAGAAATIAVAALGALLWQSYQAPGDVGRDTVAAESAAQPAVLDEELMAQRAELARSEDGVLLARQNLIEAVEGPKEHLSPETVAVIEENMRIIDQAIGQIRIALEDDPLNHELNMLLATYYQQEAELLKRVSGV
jgi:anti-sigma-K factor RskA